MQRLLPIPICPCAALRKVDRERRVIPHGNCNPISMSTVAHLPCVTAVPCAKNVLSNKQTSSRPFILHKAVISQLFDCGEPARGRPKVPVRIRNTAGLAARTWGSTAPCRSPVPKPTSARCFTGPHLTNHFRHRGSPYERAAPATTQNPSRIQKKKKKHQLASKFNGSLFCFAGRES